MTKYACSESKLTALGDAIRDKAGTTGKMTLDEMATAVEGISTGIDPSVLPEGVNTVYYTIKDSVPAGSSSAPGCGSKDIVAAIAPNATSIGNYGFYNCSVLTGINLPNATSIGNYGFYNCSVLTSLNLPSVVTVGEYAFRQLYALTVVDFGKVESFGLYAFSSCSALTSIVIRQSEKVCSMATSYGQAALYTSCRNLASIYVPDALVDSYKSTTGWSSYASKIKPLSEYKG